MASRYESLSLHAQCPLGDTPVLRFREEEIGAWLEEHGGDVWLALDDMPLELPEQHVVRTDPYKVLTEEDVDEAIEKLWRQREKGFGMGSESSRLRWGVRNSRSHESEAASEQKEEAECATWLLERPIDGS